MSKLAESFDNIGSSLASLTTREKNGSEKKNMTASASALRLPFIIKEVIEADGSFERNICILI